MSQLTLEILTPQKRILKTETPFVTIPGSEGELGVLPEHVPLVTTVKSGVLAYEEEGQRKLCAVHYGYAQVQGGTVTLLTEMAEPGDEIDLARARSAEEKAREELKRLLAEQNDEENRLEKYEAKLQRALIRQQTKP